ARIDDEAARLRRDERALPRCEPSCAQQHQKRQRPLEVELPAGDRMAPPRLALNLLAERPLPRARGAHRAGGTSLHNPASLHAPCPSSPARSPASQAMLPLRAILSSRAILPLRAILPSQASLPSQAILSSQTTRLRRRGTLRLGWAPDRE